jgi:putative ATP-binding cassette transporter
MGIQRRWPWLQFGQDAMATNGRYYQLNLVGGDHKNPEYRIAEFADRHRLPVDFIAGVPRRCCLPHLHRGALDHWRRVDGDAWRIHGDDPGFLVIAAVVYAAIAPARS